MLRAGGSEKPQTFALFPALSYILVGVVSGTTESLKGFGQMGLVERSSPASAQSNAHLKDQFEVNFECIQRQRSHSSFGVPGV